MTLHLIGLGLNKNTITLEASEALNSCHRIYLESFTVNFPYTYNQLEKEIGHEVIVLSREEVENEHILKEAQNKEIALLVYGDALAATTHTQLILSAKKQNIPTQIHHNASILIATTSMPKWQKNYEPTSFLEYYQDNKKAKAHTLILTDIDLKLNQAIEQLQAAANITGCEIKHIVVLSNAGLPTQKIHTGSPAQFQNKELPMPFCIIIPSELNHHEEETLNTFKENI
jgi:diphthine synthase